MKQYLYSADLLLPKPEYRKKWSVIACDQYTSDNEYWQSLEKTVGDFPSTLNLILPEIYLSDAKARIPKINSTMNEYLDGVLYEKKDAMVYLRRTLPSGKIRRGIVACIDLCDYDYKKVTALPIRATEGTVIERIPPRVEIRKDAALEFPHIMLFVDDEKFDIIDPFDEKAQNGDMEKLYDCELLSGGGSVCGYLIGKDEAKKLNCKISEYAKNRQMIFAVGDGNHSLATAKTCFDNLCSKIGYDAASRSPARYALCEIVNIYDECIEFEPIYRVLFGVRDLNIVIDFAKCLRATLSNAPTEKNTEFVICSNDKTYYVGCDNLQNKLPVALLSEFLDGYLKEHGDITVDYIHGEEEARRLAKRDGAMAFLFGGITKDGFFASIEKNGPLPRKAFSMGCADEKRFYFEGRKIK
ncbi:MAG: DUF1015 domain-containing protein [Clostridia bacterium]|nr:DUF1015 domain-containing protein [Clostridia bacterium]